MLIQEPKVEYWEQKNPYEHVAKCASVCYQSKLKEGKDAENFYNALISSHHVSMLRHESCYYIIRTEGKLLECLSILRNSPYVSINSYYEGINPTTYKDMIKYYISTNANFLSDYPGLTAYLQPYKVTPEEFKKECPELFRVTLCCTTSIDITREYNRVSPNNISEESTRYCNYSKDKFGDEISVGSSVGYNHLNSDMLAGISTKVAATYVEGYDLTEFTQEELFYSAYCISEQLYMALIHKGVKPEIARKVLPLATKSTVIYTYSIKEWEAILQKRLLNKTGKAHPDAIRLAELIYEQLQKLGYKLNENGNLEYVG